MKKNSNKIINIHKLQAQASQVVKEAQGGKTYTIMRYSQPVAVLISAQEYQCLTGQCRGCLKNLIKDLNRKS